MKIKSSNISLIIHLTIFSFLFIYIALRAFSIPVIHDEAATFFYYIQSGIYLPPEAHFDANNHMLNSALSRLSFQLFGPSEFALRLPNLLSFAIFYFYAYKISLRLKHIPLQWIFVISLVFAHNFIEYFALSRGYGLSMAFLLAAVYYLMCVLDNNRPIDYFLSLLFLSISIFANLTLINSAILFIGILVINLILKLRKSTIIRTLISSATILAFVLGPMYFFIELLYDFKHRGLLYYGNLDEFWNLTVGSLSKLLFGFTNAVSNGIIIYFLLLIIAISFFIFLSNKQIKTLFSSHFTFALLLFGNWMAVVFLALFMGVNYPEDRTGLYFFPFFIGSIIFLLDAVEINTKTKLALLLPLLFFPIHFAIHSNLSYSSFWKNEHIPKRFVKRVQEETAKNKFPATIGGYEMRRLCWAYDNMLLGGNLNQIQSEYYPEAISDYQVVEKEKNPDWLLNYSVIDYDSISNLSLLKRSKPEHKSLIYSYFNDTLQHSSSEFFGFYEAEIDSLAGNSIIIYTRFLFNTLIESPTASLVASISDHDGKSIRYEFVKLSWKKQFWKNTYFSGAISFENIPSNTHKINIYLWNRKKNTFDISDIHLELWKVRSK